jgi:hypothetical protein
MADQPDWTKLPEQQWPENKDPNYGLRFTHPIARENFEILRSKRVIQPKYVHIPTLQSLGILDEVQSLMSSLGIWDYCTSPFPAYRTLTYEFLSTLHMENDDLLQYYLDGREYQITLAELSNLMGFIHKPEATQVPNWEPDSSFYDFSSQLIGGPRLTYKASQISHPVFRYIQRALAFTIFARGETVASMGECEMYFIYAMLNVQTRPETLPHVSAFLVDNLLNVRINATPGGMISCGGFVTRLAIHHGVIPANGPVYRVLAPRLQKQTEFIDMVYLQTACMFSQVGNSFFFISGGRHIPLPLPFPIDKADPTTWILPLNVAPPLHPQHEHHPGAEPAAQPAVDPFGMPLPEQHHAQPPPYWAPGPDQPTPQQMFALMQTMNENITQLRTSVEARFNSVDERFTSVNQQIADLRTSINGQYGESQQYMAGQFGTFHSDITQLTTHMGRMHVQYNDLAGDIDEMAEQQHGTYHRTDRIYSHMSRSGFVSADPIPRRRRPRRPPSQETGTSSQETAPPPPKD